MAWPGGLCQTWAQVNPGQGGCPGWGEGLAPLQLLSGLMSHSPALMLDHKQDSGAISVAVDLSTLNSHRIP